MTQKEFNHLLATGGCIFEERKSICARAVTPGSKYCPKHKAQMDALSTRIASTSRSPVSKRRR